MTRKAKEYPGGCLCGHIRFLATGKSSFPHLCSCRMCQQWSGAPTVAWVEFSLDGFSWTGPGGEASGFRSSEMTVRYFCPKCGGTLGAQDDGYAKIGLNIASLDNPSAIVPGKQHSYQKSSPPWWHVSIER